MGNRPVPEHSNTLRLGRHCSAGQHPLEFVLFQFLGNLPAALFSVARDSSRLAECRLSAVDRLAPRAGPIRLGPLEYVLTSPRMHHRHHRAVRDGSQPQRLQTVNYGGLLSGFDWPFGTARR